MMKSKFKIPKLTSELLAEETGWHLGDGSMNYYLGKGLYQLRGHIKDDSDHYVQRIKPAYQELFNLNVNLRKMPSTGVYGFQVWAKDLVQFKNQKLGLPLGKKVEFQIPGFIKNSTLLKAFVRGYFDTDGCLYLEKKNGKLYPRLEMASISGKFMAQLNESLLNLGFKGSFYVEKREHKGWNDIHKVILRGDAMLNKWFSEIKPQNPKHIQKFENYNRNKNGPAEI